MWWETGAIRGEFAGHANSDGSRAIMGHQLASERSWAVIRAPHVPGGRIELGGTARGTLPISALPPPSSGAAANTLAGPAGGLSGDPANRLDVLVVGDGYTAAETALFEQDANAFSQAFFSISPYAEYQNFVNIHRLFVASNESGADHPAYSGSCSANDPTCCGDATAAGDPLAGTFVDTAFSAHFCSFNIHRLIGVDYGAVLTAASAVPDWDFVFVLVNDATYGGAGGGIAVASTHPSSADVVRHEFGHTFTDLADEYESAFPGFPACDDVVSSSCEANVTNDATPSTLKWRDWVQGAVPIPTPENDPLYSDVLGAFEGARYQSTGMYRPRFQLPDAVVRKRLLRSLQRGLRP